MMRLFVTATLMLILMFFGTRKNDQNERVGRKTIILNSSPMVRFQKRGFLSFFSTFSKGLKASSLQKALPKKIVPFKGPSKDFNPSSSSPKNTADQPPEAQNTHSFESDAKNSNDKVNKSSSKIKIKKTSEPSHSSSKQDVGAKDNNKEDDIPHSFLTSEMKEAFQAIKDQNQRENFNPDDDQQDPTFDSSKIKEEAEDTKS